MLSNYILISVWVTYVWDPQRICSSNAD